METITPKKDIIVNGPGEGELMNPFNRKRIIFVMKNRSSMQFAMSDIRLKAGTRCIYSFVTESGATGEYNARTREGEVMYPSASRILETTPKIGAQ